MARRLTKHGLLAGLGRLLDRLRDRISNFLERRPHRSFKPTPRRDLPKYPSLPGYVAFTTYCLKVTKQYRGALSGLLLLYVVATVALVGLTSQSQYVELTDSFSELTPELFGGKFEAGEKAFGLFAAAVTGGLNEPLGEVQQLYLALLGIISWLTVVWYLRYRLNGNDITLRDALYNSGSPFVATVVIALFIVLQSIPAALAVIAYSSALGAGALTGGVESMVFAVAAGLLVILSLYWVTSSFFSAIIVTIPGTYPMQAIKMGGDLVLGRRLSIMLRLLWLALILLLLWAVVLIPAILLADAIKVDWLPLVPVTIQLLSAASVIFGAVYVYLLYRKMIDEPATS